MEKELFDKLANDIVHSVIRCRGQAPQVLFDQLTAHTQGLRSVGGALGSQFERSRVMFRRGPGHPWESEFEDAMQAASRRAERKVIQRGLACCQVSSPDVG